jgi:hypothetical protein
MPTRSSLLNDGRLAAAVLGGGLPGVAQEHLRAAGQAYHRDDLAEWHLREAQASAPDRA